MIRLWPGSGRRRLYLACRSIAVCAVLVYLGGWQEFKSMLQAYGRSASAALSTLQAAAPPPEERTADHVRQHEPR